MFRRVLIANRGEISSRLIRACHKVGAEAVAVYSEADAGAPFVREADEAVAIGPGPAAESYLKTEAILTAARDSGAEALHPGYGFLSENAGFAEAVEAAGLTWVGPPPAAMRSMADKVDARALVSSAGVPVVPGTEGPVDAAGAEAAANELNFPLMVKAAKGGGGIGMTVVHDHAELAKALETATARAQAAFGDAAVFLERYVDKPRHVEVQVLGEADGRVIHLFERECSVQRRHQKVIEETPSMALDAATRAELCAAAVRAAEAVGYRSAGTVEFIFDSAAQEFYFLEMNTRLQVEHPITEVTLGVDLAEAMLRVAAGEPSGIGVVQPSGHAIEFRIYAEDPVRFLPSPGRIETWEPPQGEGIRVDSGVAAGYTVSHFYDPLLAKLIVSAGTREAAIDRAVGALETFRIEGVKHNLPTHLDVLASPEFRAGDYDTGLLSLLGERRKEPAGT
ncbi:MAG TPA: biotin carboxylase N-terminal domain-containing protein [Candidatus Dormibacteraeota bacterium]|jgi:acetyl-CoA carboxylase biotin carboxylase subunit|nr:biotin carboxylase N-terminal domain-containing protein [Candidatus Dormibacteraeota bacterium]